MASEIKILCAGNPQVILEITTILEEHFKVISFCDLNSAEAFLSVTKQKVALIICSKSISDNISSSPVGNGEAWLTRMQKRGYKVLLITTEQTDLTFFNPDLHPCSYEDLPEVVREILNKLVPVA